MMTILELVNRNLSRSIGRNGRPTAGRGSIVVPRSAVGPVDDQIDSVAGSKTLSGTLKLFPTAEPAFVDAFSAARQRFKLDEPLRWANGD